MWPGASVSGYYLWNPASHYFGVGRIGRDQLADYASRKGVPLDEAERWLAPNLADEERGEDHGGRRALIEAFATFPARFAAAARLVAGRPVPDGEWGPTEVVRHLIAVEDEVWRSRLALLAARTIRTGRGPSPVSRRAWTTRSARRRARGLRDGAGRPRPPPSGRSTTPVGLAPGPTTRTAVSTSRACCASPSTTTRTTSRASTTVGRAASGIVRTVVDSVSRRVRWVTRP